MHRTLLAAFMLPALFASGQPALAGQKAARIEITPQSAKAAIIIKAPFVQPPSPAYKTSYRLNFQHYDPVAQQIKGGPFGGSATLAASLQASIDGFMVLDLKPGTYVVSSFSRQDYWTLCFQDDSVQFTIGPGEILYLGYFDAKREVNELTRKALESRRIVTRGESVDFFDMVSPPLFLPITEEGLAAARAMARAHMPRSTVEPTAVAFSPARFGTGSTLYGKRRCGGYFPEKAKSAAR